MVHEDSSTANDNASTPNRAFSVTPAKQLDLLTLPAPSEGIEILVQLAKQGDIDPWNVDLVKVADTYLAYVETLQWEAGQVSSTDETPSSSVMNAVKSGVDETPILALREGILSETEQQQLRLTGKTLLYLAILLRMKTIGWKMPVLMTL